MNNLQISSDKWFMLYKHLIYGNKPTDIHCRIYNKGLIESGKAKPISDNPLQFADLYGQTIIKIIIARDLQTFDLLTGKSKENFRGHLAFKYVKGINQLREYIS